MHDPYGLGPAGNGNPTSAQPGPSAQPGYQPGYPPGYGAQPGYGASGPHGGGFGAPPQQGYAAGYGQPQGGYPPPPGPQGYVSYGQGMAPPNVYTPPAAIQTSELTKLEDDAQLWLLVAAAGFWVGFGWVTGPLAWYFGSQIRGKYRALGHHPCASANWAWGIGIVSTALYSLIVIGVVVALMAIFGALAL